MTVQKSRILKYRKRIAVRVAYIGVCFAASASILWGLFQMAAAAPVPALIAMTGVAALSFVHHDIKEMVAAEARERRQDPQ